MPVESENFGVARFLVARRLKTALKEAAERESRRLGRVVQVSELHRRATLRLLRSEYPDVLEHVDERLREPVPMTTKLGPELCADEDDQPVYQANG